MKFLYYILFSTVALTGIAQQRTIPVDTTITSQHSIQIKGRSVSYTAETGTMPVWDEKGVPIATIHYTYYKRNNVTSQNRPIAFSFNGGPGSASAWMHIAYTGPKLLNIDEEGYPVQPYGVRDNPNSILDVADIVFVNPVNTGYSRMIPNEEGEYPDREQFFGINEDARYLAEWMNTFMSRKNRWESPKYIIGESYGGTRVMALAHELQNSQWMYLNGVIMVSPADYKVLRRGGPVAEALNLPYYTATAWYHKQLPSQLQQQDLTELLPEVEQFTVNEYIPALAKGGFIESAQKSKIAKQLAYYTAIDQQEIERLNLSIPTSFFWKELLRDESGQTVGRLDSRYLGFDRVEVGTRPDYNAELSSWLHSFTPAINYYMREELGFHTDIKYNMFGDVRPWNMDNDNVRENLREAMAANPYLNVFVQSGYYDGATTYFNAKYTLWQLDPSGRLKDRLSFSGYRSGHMMYLRQDDLENATNDIREFIANTTYKDQPAKYFQERKE